MPQCRPSDKGQAAWIPCIDKPNLPRMSDLHRVVASSDTHLYNALGFTGHDFRAGLVYVQLDKAGARSKDETAAADLDRVCAAGGNPFDLPVGPQTYEACVALQPQAPLLLNQRPVFLLSRLLSKRVLCVRRHKEIATAILQSYLHCHARVGGRVDLRD